MSANRRVGSEFVVFTNGEAGGVVLQYILQPLIRRFEKRPVVGRTEGYATQAKARYPVVLPWVILCAWPPVGHN